MKRLPDSELEIMMIIWDAKEDVTSEYIMQRIEKKWAKPTVLNFLARLCERGFLERAKDGRQNIYRPTVGIDEYQKRAARDFVKRVFHNSPTGLLAALWDSGEISREERQMLKDYIESDGKID